MHSFEPADAEKYGILEAVLLANIRWWVTKNASNNKHWYDGHYWTYNSAKAFAKMFPYASQQQIQRALKKLEMDGIVLVSNYNSNPYDHTKWYTTPISGTFDRSHLINHDNEIDQPSNTDINQMVNKGSVLDAETNLLFEIFWKAYPNKKAKENARKAFAKLKPTNDTLCMLQQAVEHQKRSIWKDKDPQYIPHAATWINGKRWEDEIQPVVQDRNPFAGAI